MSGEKPSEKPAEAPDPDQDDDLDVPGGERERGFTAKLIGDLARRALTTGIGAVFMSEDALRGSLSEMKLPKEAMQYVVGQADRTKKEIVNAIARETREFLSRLEVDKVLARALVGTTIEIQTRIRVLPKGDGMSAAVESTDARLVSVDDEDSAPRKRKRRGRKADDPDAG